MIKTFYVHKHTNKDIHKKIHDTILNKESILDYLKNLKYYSDKEIKEYDDYSNKICISCEVLRKSCKNNDLFLNKDDACLKMNTLFNGMLKILIDNLKTLDFEVM